MPIHDNRSEYQSLMSLKYGLIANGVANMLDGYIKLNDPNKEFTKNQAEYIRRIDRVFDALLFETSRQQELDESNLVDTNKVLKDADLGDLEYLIKQAKRAKYSAGFSLDQGYTVEELHELASTYRRIVHDVTGSRKIEPDQVELVKATTRFLKNFDYYMENPN